MSNAPPALKPQETDRVYFEKVRIQVAPGLPDPVVRELVRVGNPDKIKEVRSALSRLDGEAAHGAYSALYDEKVAKAFVQDPSGVLRAFAEITKSMELYRRPGTEHGPLWVLKGNVPLITGRFYDRYGEAKALLDSLGLLKDKNVIAFKTEPELLLGCAYAISVIGERKTRELHEKFGIDYFARYTKEQLEDLCAHADDRKQSSKPVLLAVFNKADSNGFFYAESRKLEQLMKGYTVIITETDSEDGFYGAVSDVSKKYGKIDTLAIGGHGDPDGILLGYPKGKSNDKSNEKGHLDLSDEDEMRRIADCFVKRPSVILISCSTGKGEHPIGALISRAWGAHLSAPEEDLGAAVYLTDKSGKLVSVTYSTSVWAKSSADSDIRTSDFDAGRLTSRAGGEAALGRLDQGLVDEGTDIYGFIGANMDRMVKSKITPERFELISAVYKSKLKELDEEINRVQTRMKGDEESEDFNVQVYKKALARMQKTASTIRSQLESLEASVETGPDRLKELREKEKTDFEILMKHTRLSKR